MEAVLSNYLQNGRYFVRRGQLPLRDLAKQIKFRPADDFEREVALLNLHWRVHRDGNATYQLLHLAESHPDSPRPHELLAAVAMEKKDIEGAIVHWRRAADLGSDNAYIYLQLAQDRLNRILDGFSLDYRMPAESAKELRGWLDRAIALDPRGDAACESLVLVEALSEIPRSEVVNGLVARLPRMRSKNLTRYALAVLYWRQKRFAASRSTAESLLLAADLSPDLKVATEQLLEQIPAGPAPAGEPKPAAAEPAMAAQQPAAKQ
jgi:tetratricopeptide (TPR) repeat protein